MVLPNKITAQGWALAPIALATRPQGAPLTVILGGKRMPGTEDGPGSDLLGEGSAQRYGGDRRPAESGAARPGGGVAPVGLPPEGARHWPPPRSRTVAPPLSRLVLAVVPVAVTHSRSMTSASC